jgi:hypothetical protein
MTNVLDNPGFDPASLSGWTVDQAGAFWSTSDADGCTQSGSLAFSGAQLAGQVSQCKPVQANTRYYFGLKYRQPNDFSVFCTVATYAASDTTCTGSQGTTGATLMIAPVVGSWASLSASIDTGANGRAKVLCNFWKDSVEIDQIYLNTVDSF